MRRVSRYSDQGPRRLGPSLDRLAGNLGLPSSEGVARVFARWGDIVGPSVAAHATPILLDTAKLVVRVDHPAWATQIRHFSGDLLDRVAEVGEVRRPERLEVRIRG